MGSGKTKPRVSRLTVGAACLAGMLVAPGQARAEPRYETCGGSPTTEPVQQKPADSDPVQLQAVDPNDVDGLAIEAAPADGWAPLCVRRDGKEGFYLERTRSDNPSHGILIRVEYSKTGYDLRKALARIRGSLLREAARPSEKDCPATDLIEDSTDEGDSSQSWRLHARYYTPSAGGSCEVWENFEQITAIATAQQSYLVFLYGHEPPWRAVTDRKLPSETAYDEDLDPQLLDAIGDQIRDGVTVRAS